MALTPNEMVNYFEDEIEAIDEAINNALDKNDYNLITLNYSEKFNAHLMVALIDWRHELRNPFKSLSNAFLVAEESIDIFNRIDSSKEHWKSFDYTSALFVSILIDASAQKLKTSLCDIDNWKSHINQNTDSVLETCIIKALYEGEEPKQWEGIIAHMGKRKRIALLTRTYSNYMSIINDLRAGNQFTSEEHVREAIKLFNLRSQDSYYEGGLSISGGGPDNAHVVDFILAAIIKFIRIENLKFAENIDSFHFWKC